MHVNEVKNNAFYQFPQWLLKDEPYKSLGDKAKMMYMLLFDRRGLSVKNKWYDEDGKIYIYFTIEQFMQELNCSNKAVVKAKKELVQAGLLKEVRQGVNKPNRLYINGRVESTLQEVNKVHKGRVESTLQEVNKVHGINTNNINTNISNNKYINNSLGDTLKRLDWLDSIQVQRILEYVGLDGMDVKVVLNAIERCANGNIRNFNYLNGILSKWREKGITTLEQVAKEDALFKKNKESSKMISDPNADKFAGMEDWN